MDKRIVLIIIIIILLVMNISAKVYQKKLYNTYSKRNNIVDNSKQAPQLSVKNNLVDNSKQKEQSNSTYNIEDESIKFVYKFLSNWQNNLTPEYLDDNIYNTYTGDKKIILENYMKKLEVVDKTNNEIILVKSGTSTNIVTKTQYVNLTLYVSEKKNKYTSIYATEIKNNTPDANKKFTIVVYSDSPYNFKIRLFLGSDSLTDNGRSI